MTGEGSQDPAEGWDWIRQGAIRQMACLIFVRAVTPERVIEAFGMEPAAAMLLPETRVMEAMQFPVCDDDAVTVAPYIRVGRVGEWAFAICQSGLDIVDYPDEIVRRLSAGTDAVTVMWVETLNNVVYLADGEWVTTFQPEMAWSRLGSDPDRFLTEMRAAGLRTEPPSPDDGPGEGDDYVDQVIAALDTLTMTLGIRLPAEVAKGALLTVQRAPDGMSS
jgi:Family of unknown function (DUF6461)